MDDSKSAKRSFQDFFEILLKISKKLNYEKHWLAQEAMKKVETGWTNWSETQKFSCKF